jgi:hypothetical protein
MNRRKRASGYETQLREQAERYAATLRTGRSNDGGADGMRCAFPPYACYPPLRRRAPMALAASKGPLALMRRSDRGLALVNF